MALLPLPGFSQSVGIADPNAASQQVHAPVIIPAAPSVAALMKIEEVPVDNYTGTPDISLPLHSFALEGGLSLGAGISYSSTGVRVDDIPGWVGAGWSLSCGGSISRTMLGKPDELDHGILVNGFEGLPGMGKEASEEFLWNCNRFRWDTEADLFQFNFMGITGRFVLKKDPVTGVITAENLGGDKVLKIAFTFSTGGSPTNSLISFEIVDDYGYIYSFGAPDLTNSTALGADTAEIYNSAWHLLTIQSPDHRQLCALTYQKVQESYYTPVSISWNQLIGLRPTLFGTTWDLLPGVSWSNSHIQVNSSVLSSVTVPNKGKLSFTTAARTQVLGDPRFTYQGYKLNSVQVRTANDSLVKSYNFNMTAGSLSGKIFLTSIDEVYTPSKKQTYTMDYKNMSQLPAFGNNSKDYWGYYNGAANLETTAPIFGADREVNATYITTGVLQDIVYPNGGQKVFYFEPNSFSYVGNKLLDPVDPVHIPENRQFHPASQSYNSGAGNSSTTITIANEQYVKFTLTATGYSLGKDYYKNDIAGSDIWIVPVSPSGPKQILNIMGCSTLTTLDQQHIIEVTSCSIGVNLTPGTYSIQFQAQTPSGYIASNAVSYRLNYNYYTMAPTYRISKGGGLRIARTELRDNGVLKSSKSYNYGRPGDASYSSGMQYVAAKKMVRYVSTGLFAASSETPPGSWSWGFRISYKVFDDQSGLDIPLIKGNYVVYSNVAVTDNWTGTGITPGPVENGRTEYRYSCMLDFTDVAPGDGYAVYPYNYRPSYDYKYGLLLEKKVFDSNNRILGRESYDYTYEQQLREFGLSMKQNESCDCPIVNNLQHYTSLKGYFMTYYKAQALELAPPQDPVTYANGMWNDAWSASEYSSVGENHSIADCLFIRRYMWLAPAQYIVGWAKLAGKRSESYQYPTAAATPFTVLGQQQQYSYNGVNKQPDQSITILSPSESIITRYFYPDMVTTLANLPGGSITQENLNVITLMNKSNQHRISVPLEVQTLRTTFAGQATRDAEIISTQRTLYRNWNTPTGLLLPEMIQESKGMGALVERLRYTGVDTATGNITEVLQDGQFTRYLWGYNGTQPIAKISYDQGVQIPSASLLGTAQTASNSGSRTALLSALDAIRTSMPGAMVTTLTYRPMIGISTITDPTGYRLYYDYDEFLRLKAVSERDRDGNTSILSTSEYNYKTPAPLFIN